MDFQKFNNTSMLLEFMQDIYIIDDGDQEKLLSELDLTAEEFDKILMGDLEPDKIQLENIYNFIYDHGFEFNEIMWQYRLDEYRNDRVQICSHGSRRNINGDIRVDLPTDSDFGSGFYLGQDIAQAGMWVSDSPDSSLYIFSLDTQDLVKAQFNVTLEWMLAVCYYRNQLEQYKNHPTIQEIVQKVEACDYVFAPIADNELYEVLQSFVHEEITDLQCLYAISATHLGYQYVLKTEKAVQHLELLDHLYYGAVEKSKYNRGVDVTSNVALRKAFMMKKTYKNQGHYISDLLRS